MLSFALSAIFLMIALSAFYTARGNSDHVVTGAELRSIADRVAARIVEAGRVAQEFPNATLNLTIDIPQTLNGHTYRIEASDTSVTATARDVDLAATATTFRLDAIEGILIDGDVESSNERLVVTYSHQDTNGDGVLDTKSIHIHEEY